MATIFPTSPLDIKAELLVTGVWTDISKYLYERDPVNITNIGRVDENSSIQTSQMTLTLNNRDFRFTPKYASGAYFPAIAVGALVRISVGSASTKPLGTIDGTFETGVANWTPTSATFAQSSVQAHSGTKSGLLTVTGTPAQAFVRPTLAASAPVTVGTSYTASGWLYSAAGYAFTNFAIDWYTSGGVFLSTSSGSNVALPAGQWMFCTVTGTAPATAAFGEYGPSITGTPPAGTAVFLDEATMQPAINVYSGFRFCGEVMSWPPSSDSTGVDITTSIVAVGIWTRIQQSSTPIGSSYKRYVNQLTGADIPAGHWTFEDGGSGTGAATLFFVSNIGAGGNAAVTASTPSYAADSTSFLGSDSLMQFNNARITCTVSGGGTPTNNVIRFALAVPPGGDGNQPTGNWNLAEVDTTGTVKKLECYMLGNGKLQFDGVNNVGTIVFTTSTTTNVRGIPLLVSMKLTPSGANLTWTLEIIKPGAGSVLETKTGTLTTASINTVTAVKLNRAGMLSNTTFGQLTVNYTVPSILTAAAALGGHAGEFAVDRFTRLCAEFNIASTVIGSTSAAMGPQFDDTLANLLQSVENTDGGLLYESRDTFGLGYRTLLSMQNQSPVATLDYTTSVLSPPFPATYDTQLLKNQWTVNNWDGYSTLATLTSGARSIQNAPNGVGIYAGGPLDIVANTHAQTDAIAKQRLFQGADDEVRYPQLNIDMERPELNAFFASVPGLRIGDYIQITNLPTFHGTSTAKLMIWGYQESLNNFTWGFTFNAVPESPFETAFNPGVFSVTQVPGGSVSQGSPIGSSVSGSQLGAGSVPATALTNVISAKSLGGLTYFTGAPTPYGWTFAVSGTPADVGYFICTEDQAQAVIVGDTFVNTGGFGGPFTVTSLDPPSGGNVNVHFQPDASSVMSSGTVNGATNGDEWINSSGGNQINKWVNGAWVPITFNAQNVIVAGSITATQIAALTITAGLLVAGIVVSGIVDATVVQASSFLAVGSSGEFLAYSASPAAGNMVFSISGMSGTDGFTNAYAQGAEVHIGGLVLDNQASAPSTVTGSSIIYSGSQGRLRFINTAGVDLILDRSVLDITNFTMGTQTIPHILSSTLNYVASEALVGSEYEIECDGTITTPSGTTAQFTFDYFLDGVAFAGTSAITVGGVIIQTGFTYAFTLRLRATVQTTGAGGTVNCALDGSMTRKVAGVGNAQQFTTLNNVVVNCAFDTTAAHSLAMYCNWSSTVGTGHSAIVYRTKKTRRN